MPCALYILARYGERPEEAIIRAVNDTKDNDTVAAIVGAAIGALHGRSGLPAHWINELSGRTGADDNWHIFELIESARQSFWHTDPPLSEENIRAVLEFLPVINQPDLLPGECINGGGNPNENYTEIVTRFKRVLYDNGFIQPFNWPAWKEGDRFITHPALLKQTSLQTLRKLLTTHVLKERFSEGHLLAMLRSGHIYQILKRMEELLGLSANSSN